MISYKLCDSVLCHVLILIVILYIYRASNLSKISKSEYNKLFQLTCIDCSMEMLLELYLREGISMVQERHSYNTRNSVLSLVLPSRVNSSGDKSFSYIASKFWNQLHVPIPIRATENPLHFRSIIKKHFMSLVKTEEENIFI